MNSKHQVCMDKMYWKLITANVIYLADCTLFLSVAKCYFSYMYKNVHIQKYPNSNPH